MNKGGGSLHVGYESASKKVGEGCRHQRISWMVVVSVDKENQYLEYGDADTRLD